MNEEIVKDYEWDLDFFLIQAANAKMERELAVNNFEDGLKAGSYHTFVLAANRQLFRLSFSDVKQYNNRSFEERGKYIESRISQIIKEKTNAPKT